MKSEHVIPVLAGSERDADGRLVGLTYDSTPAPLPGGICLLAALDSSDNGLRALEHAASQVAAIEGCRLHLVHVEPWLAKEAAETELASRALGATARGRRALDNLGQPWRLHVAMGDPAECILRHGNRLAARTIVVGTRGLNAVETLLLGSVATKVLHQSRIPVLVVP